MIAYKFLASGAQALFRELCWPQPLAGTPGQWVEASPAPLEPCGNGIHGCEVADLPYWISDELWQIELDPECIAGPQSLVARRGRLLRRIDAWNPAAAQAFASACLARAESYVAALPEQPELADRGQQYLATARATLGSGSYGVTAYAAAMAFTLLADSASDAFAAERVQQAQLLAQALDL